jgi:hypothetical protein
MTSISITPALSDMQHPTSISSLRKGDVVRIEVLEFKPDGRVLADVGRCRCLANMGFPVEPGDVFWAKVLHGGRPLELQLIAAENSNADPTAGPSRAAVDLTEIGRVLYWLASSKHGDNEEIQQLAQALAALHRQAQPLDLGGAPSQIAARITDLVENSGLLFEKRLADALPGCDDRFEIGLPDRLKRLLSSDVKASLVRLKTMFDTASSALSILRNDARASVQHTVNSLLSDLSRQQTRLIHAESNPFLLFTLPWKDGPAPIQLKWFLSGRRNRRRRNAFRLCLLLTLDRLGDVRADFFLEKKSLIITLTVSNDRIKETLEPACRELTPFLTDCFDPVVLQVRVSASVRQQFQTGSEQAPVFHDGQVDLRV